MDDSESAMYEEEVEMDVKVLAGERVDSTSPTPLKLPPPPPPPMSSVPSSSSPALQAPPFLDPSGSSAPPPKSLIPVQDRPSILRPSSPVASRAPSALPSKPVASSIATTTSHVPLQAPSLQHYNAPAPSSAGISTALFNAMPTVGFNSMPSVERTSHFQSLEPPLDEDMEETTKKREHESYRRSRRSVDERKLQKQVEDTKNVMVRNIETVLARGV